MLHEFRRTGHGGPIAAVGDAHADWGQFLSAHRDRLRRMVALRLDQRLRGRIDPSDVIQEAFLEATERRPEYERQSDPMPPFLWLRFLTLQRLQLIHRRQLGTKSRHAGREVSIHGGAFPAARSAALAAQLLGRDTRPSEAAIRAERKRRLQEVARPHGPDRPGSARPAPLRTASQRRVRTGARARRVGGDQALPPGLETAQRHPLRPRGGPMEAGP